MLVRYKTTFEHSQPFMLTEMMVLISVSSQVNVKYLVQWKLFACKHAI